MDCTLMIVTPISDNEGRQMNDESLMKKDKVCHVNIYRWSFKWKYTQIVLNHF